MNHLSRFRMFPFAAGAIRSLKKAGFAVVVVTNQSGVARGYFPEALLEQVHAGMRQDLESQSASLDGVYYCKHAAAENCDCRKPKPGMIARAAEELRLDLSRSFMVGDRYGDIETGFNAGTRTVFVKTGYGLGEWTLRAKDWPRQPDWIAENLEAAAGWILENTR